ncbi:MAG TPA: SRPBCC family protein [Candidatus Dormibacteraeota bacterium]|nr:SRPBCC family protein [Candidatus Dormibacteraeota bacterium]
MAKEVKSVPTTEYTIEPGKHDLTSVTILDAPRELVFKAYTDPKLFAQWWGPRRYTNHIDKFDSRSGGEWRVVQRAADGDEHAFRGVNHEVTAPERIASTFEYEGVPGHVALQIATFEPLGNKTRLVAHMIFESVMDRDGMVAAGMQSGADESTERLSELLDRMKGGR